MGRLHSILLLDTESSVIKDVSSSLKLVNIPVTSVSSVEEALHSLSVVKPSVVLCRRSVESAVDVAHDLQREIYRNSLGENIPIVLLLKKGEESLFEGSLDRFQGVLHLPVEFPLFTHHVQDLLGKLTVAEQAAPTRGKALKRLSQSIEELEELPDPLPTAEQRSAEAAKSLRPSNLAVAYDIQLRVIGELSQQPSFATVDAEQVARVLREATEKICSSYDPKKIFGY